MQEAGFFMAIVPKINIVHPQYWVSILLFFCFLTFVFVKIYYRKPFEQIFQSFFATKLSQPDSRDEFSTSGRISVFLSLLFLLTISLFIFQTWTYYKGLTDTFNGLLFYSKVILFIALTYVIKVGSIHGIGYIFKTPHIASEYVNTIFLFIKILGVALLPLTIALAFMPIIPDLYLISLGLTIIGIAFALRTAKVLSLGMHNKAISGFYLFLYLCTLEFLPLVVLIKVFMNNKGLFS